MNPSYIHTEHHNIHRVGWLRASVLGANDGIVSTASLVIGVASADATPGNILIAGLAGLVAGAMSMAAGEFVSVSSQADVEKADLEIEKQALKEYPEAELEELAGIYRERGLKAETAMEVARQLTEADALAAHARDELGLTDHGSAQPVQAALSSAASFAVGAFLPLVAAILSPASQLTAVVAVVSLIALAILGALSARAGGASKRRAVFRVVFWGAAAMLVTGLIGAAFGTVV
ncbi:MAG TPA: VIT family protein [Hyphomonas sp.]|nr:VIT family protein [Hyphomonas sp.]MCA8905758.1 VIT family protein [Hyphomonas sp.]MCB9962349.1 VIT family protein [Hyphomonas sp.]MCB9972860.1 VIT family protein [Hyphomonas sp.]HPE48556.1 VIT family protein [Hyphomonas sp.]